jgi:hypothetical protein
MVDQNIKVLIELGPSERDNPPEMSIEEQVRHCIECIQTYAGDHAKEWSYLRSLYTDLAKAPKQTPRITNLRRMIEPILTEYGVHVSKADHSEESK